MKLGSLLSLYFLIGLISCNEPAKQRPNVLFIAVDDLRPDLGIYNHPLVHSPNIDGLAKQGVVFTNHYVTVPTCGASRASLLTGLLPSSRTHLSNQVFRDVISKQSSTEKPETFVHYLRENGYYTVGLGKISHSADGLIYGYDEPVGTEKELPLSWDEMLLDHGDWGTGWNAFFGYSDGKNRTDLDKNVEPFEAADVPDEGYPDGLTANLAVKKLSELASRDQPFFLGVGFFKPHLPFNAPKKYWDLYNIEEIELSPNPTIPANINNASLHNSGEFNQYKLGKEKAGLDTVLSDDYAKRLVHGYLASVSYTDAQIGKVLKALKSLNLEDNTLIVLWSDHGWHLGDHRVWGKHTLFERSLRSPLIIKPPGLEGGLVSDEIVSSVDLYPTIAELCGLPVPQEIDGRTLSPILNATASDRNGRAFSYFKNGISLRTDRYRLTQYSREALPVIELYDHLNDPQETINIASGHPDLVADLLRLLKEGDTGLYNSP